MKQGLWSRVTPLSHVWICWTLVGLMVVVFQHNIRRVHASNPSTSMTCVTCGVFYQHVRPWNNTVLRYCSLEQRRNIVVLMMWTMSVFCSTLWRTRRRRSHSSQCGPAPRSASSPPSKTSTSTPTASRRPRRGWGLSSYHRNALHPTVKYYDVWNVPLFIQHCMGTR